MATTGVGFRWLDILEKDFDKAIVELDTSLTELEVEDAEIVYAARQKIATLSSCFAQLTHKALTIFQSSAKLEAELVDMRAELVEARAASVNGHEAGEGASSLLEGSHARYEAAQFARENATLRETVLALHSELFGARLATKYLDKELAGRIQQLQLLGRDMRSEIRDSLWAQVEAEILLQRHKTLVRVCRGLAPCPPRPPRSNRAPLASRPRTVRVRRSPHLGLGISVTGGREHGVPILISELETGGPAALTGQLYVGDAILAINDLDLTQACHKEAVQALQSVKGDCALCVQFIATDDDDQLSDDNYRFPLYPDDGETYDPEPNGSGATPTAPRTPEFNRPHSATRSASEEEEEPTKYTEPDHKPPVTLYPEYINNTINNNLSILEIDDDSIKMEAIRNRGAYRGPLPASSNDSAGSTPVHLRRTSLKKKRVKPFDWRSKGAYRAVDDDPSSDETETLPINGHGISTVFDKPKEEPVPKVKEEPAQKEATNVEENLEINETPLVNIPTVPLPPPQEVVIPAITTIKPKNTAKPNGLDSNLLRNKMFRIGSAKRVLETAPTLSNGDTIIDRIKYPSHLLSGDGDPDFGTPV